MQSVDGIGLTDISLIKEGYLRGRLSALYFLQFAVWGCYLTSLGQFLGAGGLGADIAWFYAAIGLVSIVTPALMGHVADRFVRPSRLLSFCHITAGGIMLAAWIYALYFPRLEFGVFYPLYLLFLAFYMPTMALSNTVTFGIIKSAGHLPVDKFPTIRVWGTVGFIAAMWMVNSTYWHDGHLGWTLSESHPFAAYRFQYNSMQLFCTGCIGIITGLFAFTLPAMARGTGGGSNVKSRFRIFNFRILKDFFYQPRSHGNDRNSLSRVGVFLIFIAFIGVCMQISNGFATPFISHFLGMSEYADNFAAGNATMLFSLSQISEALVILAVGKSLKKWGIGVVLAVGMLAWSLRFFFFGIGNPSDGLVFLILSMLVYGVAFNFITIAGHLHMETVSPENAKGLGQGVMMLMSNGIGATAGVIAAGAIINHWCQWEMVTANTGVSMRLFMGDWNIPWMIFAGFAFVLFGVWCIYRSALRL